MTAQTRSGSGQTTAMFQNRRHAGQIVAQKVSELGDIGDAIVLGIPRGGVPVAYEVAHKLNLPLDIFLVRKLGVPGQEELAMGAIASGGTIVINQTIVQSLDIRPETIEAVARREQLEIERRELAYRDGHPPLPVDERTIILIDDGIATGASMLAAARALRPKSRRLIVAVPVAAQSACNELSAEVDQMICAITPQSFVAVGEFYQDFRQTTDEEVRSLLSKAHNDTPGPARSTERIVI
jgi:predicted phosphoribosyltransferase